MTDTDDTDELLLIPPDFFSVESDSGHSETVQPYYNIVDNLIKQVDNLQHRLKTIESYESCSNSLDQSSESLQKMENQRQSFRRYKSTDNISVSQNSPPKPQTKFKLNSLPNSPNVDRAFNKKNFKGGLHQRLYVNEQSPSALSKKYARSEKDNQTLNEIDTFLSKVKTIQRINAARNLESDFNNYGVSKHIHSQVSDLPKDKEEISTKQKIWPNENENKSDYKETVYDQDISIENPEMQTSTIDNSEESPNFTLDSLNYNPLISLTDSSSDSTQVTAYTKHRSGPLLTNPIHSNAVNVINVHKKLLADSGKKIKDMGTFEHRPRGKNTIVGDNLGAQLSLMNLNDIWNANNHTLTKSQLTQKLEEEKYRRQHCEELIQELQSKNLELQQKISVAVKVDERKNLTIKKYQDALEKLILRIEKLSKEKVDLDFEINKLKTQHIDEKETSDQKLSHYENELTRVLNVAQISQEKTIALEKRCSELEAESQSLSKKLESLQQDYTKECDKYKQMSEILAQKELELNENKTTLSTARTEISQTREAVELCQSEFNKMKEDYIKMDSNLKEERAQKLQLNKKMTDLMQELEGNKQQQGTLQDEIAKNKKLLESNKIDLRNYYQGQVEILVQSKLKEFQSQLNETENKFKEEINRREMAIAKSAATHIQQISEKYSLEIKLLEKKHQEESKLYQIQIMQHKQQIENLQNKLDSYQEKRIAIAKQLQKVMESQWHEALKIITSGKSPTFNDESAFSTIDQLNCLKTKSYNNLEEVLSQHDDDPSNDIRIRNDHDETGSTVSNKGGFVRFAQPIETPVSSRVSTSRALTGNDVQQFLSLLLNKPSGDPDQEGIAKGSDDVNNGLSYFQDNEGNRTNQRGQYKERKGPKPPWK